MKSLIRERKISFIIYVVVSLSESNILNGKIIKRYEKCTLWTWSEKNNHTKFLRFKSDNILNKLFHAVSLVEFVSWRYIAFLDSVDQTNKNFNLFII